MLYVQFSEKFKSGEVFVCHWRAADGFDVYRIILTMKTLDTFDVHAFTERNFNDWWKTIIIKIKIIDFELLVADVNCKLFFRPGF